MYSAIASLDSHILNICNHNLTLLNNKNQLAGFYLQCISLKISHNAAFARNCILILDKVEWLNILETTYSDDIIAKIYQL